jgi:S-layer homology domain
MKVCSRFVLNIFARFIFVVTLVGMLPALPVKAESFASPLFTSGDSLWAKSMGQASGEASSGITLDLSGDIYTTGNFYNTADFDPGVGTVNLTSLRGFDVFVPKLENAPIVVNTAVEGDVDNLNCSLVEAMNAANLDVEYHGCAAGSGADTITFAGNYTINTVDIQLPDVSTQITINGNGSENTIIQVYLNPFNYARAFQVNSTGNLTLNKLTVKNGRSNSGGGILNAGILTVNNSTISNNSSTVSADGGGIYNNIGGNLTVINSTFSGNYSSSGRGGGIYNRGTLTITNSTFSNNSAGIAGGIFNAEGTLTVTNSTFWNNTGAYGGGIYNEDGSNFHLKNTILANSASGVDCYNSSGDIIATNTNNLIMYNGPSGKLCGTPALTSDPMLGSLANNGGFTQTFGLLIGSPAINAGNDTVCLVAPVSNTSQNGVTRPQGSHCDIGSYEFLQTFSDVPNTHPYWQDIEILYANGLTAGCSVTPFNFCPDQIMDRAQFGVFTLRGNYGTGYTPPVAPWNLFADDWSSGAWAEKWAEGMYNAGLTAGCATGPLIYCPWDQTPKVQAVVFGLRLKYGNAYVPPAATGTVFFDMTNTAYFGTKWAEQAYADGLLPNCGTDIGSGKPLFCPNDLVSRGLAAYMIVRAKSLTMP